MKKFLTRLAAIAVCCAASLPAVAGPFQIGPIVGANVNSIKLNSVADNFSADNRCGFAVGAMAKFTVPIVNIGVDLSAMYEYRTAQMQQPDQSTSNLHYNYLAIPIHVRYDVPMPAISKIIYPTIFTGPNLAFRLGKSVLNDFKANKYNIGWDFGIGITLAQHLQISAAYTLGINNNAFSYVNKIADTDINTSGADIKGKTNGWTITAAYLF